MSDIEAGALTVAVLFLLAVFGILWKPASGLILAGLLCVIGGALMTISGGLLGPSAGISALIGGIVLIGFARMIVIAQDIAAELKGLRGAWKSVR